MSVKKSLIAFSALNLAISAAHAQSILDTPRTEKSPAAAALAAAVQKTSQPPAAPQPVPASTPAQPTAKPPEAPARSALKEAAKPAANVAPQTVAAASAVTGVSQSSAQPATPTTVAVGVTGVPAVTIRELAARQAKAMAADATKPVAGQATVRMTPVVGELRPVSPIPVSEDVEVKPIKLASSTKPSPPPAPPKPYFAALVGFKGQEVAEFRMGNGTSFPLKVGGSIQNWTLTKIVDGHLILTSVDSPKAGTKKSPIKPITSKEKVLSVGDSL